MAAAAPTPAAPSSNAVSTLTPEKLELIARNKAQALLRLAEKKRQLELQRREEELMAMNPPDEFESLQSSQFESPEDVSQASSTNDSQVPAAPITSAVAMTTSAVAPITSAPTVNAAVVDADVPMLDLPEETLLAELARERELEMGGGEDLSIIS